MRSLRIVHRVLLALAAAPLLPAAASAAAPEVVVSIKPVHSLVAGVMQGVGEPALLLSGTGSPHDYSLRPSDARRLADADLVFWVGEGLETFLVRSLDALAGDARAVALSAAPGVTLLPARAGGVWPTHGHDEHQDEHAAEHEGEPGHEAEHGGHDMHLWLDPQNARAMVGAIVAALAQADPRQAALYRDNGRRIDERLVAEDARLREALAPVADRPFVVFHDAYQYFAARYGLAEVGSITVDPQRRPGARRLSAIRARLQALGAACVFAEPQFEPALVDTVIEGSSARKGVLDPLGAALAAGPDQYFALLDGLAAALVACLEQPAG
jgi:zinc transport system substrate-binding protein